MHRVFHVSRISEGAVEHYADDHASVLELEQTESKKSVVDSDTLQYFAIEAWALDIAVPGVECLGAAPPTTSTTPLVVPTSMVSANMQPFATTTSSAPSVSARGRTRHMPRSAANESHSRAIPTPTKKHTVPKVRMGSLVTREEKSVMERIDSDTYRIY
jgi:hypothetical protein